MRTHFKWMAVAAVALMLLGMFAYVASDDEAYPPVSPTAEQSAD